MKYAIPQVNINELVRVKAGDIATRIERIKSAEVLRLRGSLLPLVRLTSTLNVQSMFRDSITGELHENHRENIADRRGTKAQTLTIDNHRRTSDRRDDTPAGALNIIVVETGQVRYGLIVDGLDDSEEIVVKPLGRHIKDSKAFAGATILGDGTVALILDVAGIAQQAELRIVESRKQIEEAAAQQQNRSKDTLSMVLFTNDPKEYFGVPMGLIARIERIRGEQIDAVGGQEVLQYRGISLPLIALENYIRATPRPNLPTLFVVVFRISGREAGLIVPNLVDIRQVDASMDVSTFREQGVMGSLIIDGKAVRMIDLFELATQALPEVQMITAPVFTAQAPTPTVATPASSAAPTPVTGEVSVPTPAVQQPAPRTGKPRILLAEDSGFFRSQMVKFFEQAGYDVTGCEDGKIAWEALSKPSNHFDLVVTDIEMPNMNGYELTEHIRADGRVGAIPVIAVTSLAGEEDMQRGLTAGVTEYHVKLDRDMLLTTVARYINEAIAQAEQRA
jgi:two-component system chemotaxis sensor kinase CheA